MNILNRLVIIFIITTCSSMNTFAQTDPLDQAEKLFEERQMPQAERFLIEHINNAKDKQKAISQVGGLYQKYSNGRFGMAQAQSLNNVLIKSKQFEPALDLLNHYDKTRLVRTHFLRAAVGKAIEQNRKEEQRKKAAQAQSGKWAAMKASLISNDVIKRQYEQLNKTVVTDKMSKMQRGYMTRTSYFLEINFEVNDVLDSTKLFKNIVELSSADIEKRLRSVQEIKNFDINATHNLVFNNAVLARVSSVYSQANGWTFTISRSEEFSSIADANPGFLNKNFETQQMALAKLSGDSSQFERLKKAWLAEQPAFEKTINTAPENIIDRLYLKFLHALKVSDKFIGLKPSNGYDSALLRSVVTQFPSNDIIFTNEISASQAKSNTIKFQQDINSFNNQSNQYLAQLNPRSAKQNSDIEISPTFQQAQYTQSKRKELFESIFLPKFLEYRQTAFNAITRFDVKKDPKGYLNMLHDLDTRFSNLMSTWNRILVNHENFNYECASVSGEYLESSLISTNKNLCFDELYLGNKLLKEYLLIAALREFDNEFSAFVNQSNEEGMIFVLFNGMSKTSVLQPKDNPNCLNQTCDSNLWKLLVVAVNGEQLSGDEIKLKLEQLQNRATELKENWTTYANKSVRDMSRREYQSEIVKFARDQAPKELDTIKKSIILLALEVESDSVSAYETWDREVAQAFRWIVDDVYDLWNIGFNRNKDALAQEYFGGNTNTSPRTYTNYDYLIKDLQQYSEALTNKINQSSLAVTSQDYSTFFVPGRDKFEYKEPTRIRTRLDTPAELFFEGIGKQVGKVGVSILNYANRLNEFEKSIQQNRQAFFNCFPKCDDIDTLRYNFSNILLEKDRYFAALNPRSRSLTDINTSGQSALVQLVTGKAIIDNGIPQRCLGQFEDWIYKLEASNGYSMSNQLEDSFSILGNMLGGNLSDTQKQYAKTIDKKNKIFQLAYPEYTQYQVCRDTYEYDKWERENGALDFSSAKGFFDWF